MQPIRVISSHSFQQIFQLMLEPFVPKHRLHQSESLGSLGWPIQDPEDRMPGCHFSGFVGFQWITSAKSIVFSLKRGFRNLVLSHIK
jgi:hypothetical protein